MTDVFMHSLIIFTPHYPQSRRLNVYGGGMIHKEERRIIWSVGAAPLLPLQHFSSYSVVTPSNLHPGCEEITVIWFEERAAQFWTVNFGSSAAGLNAREEGVGRVG